MRFSQNKYYRQCRANACGWSKQTNFRVNSIKMAADEEAFVLDSFIYSKTDYRESKLKVFLLFRTFFCKLSCDKARYLSNIFDAQTLLPI